MSELGIYEGCYALLRNGEIVGPLKKDDYSGGTLYVWDGPNGMSWTTAGKIWASKEESERDIMRVGPRDLLKVSAMEASENPPWKTCGKAAIPPHVTQAAMVAGIKADPAYEQFVNAILTAGFKAQYEIEFVPMVEQAPIDMDALCEQLARALPLPKPLNECSDEMKDKLRKLADAAVSYLDGKTFPKNESENRIPDSENPKGGLSDFMPFYEPGLAEKITDTGRKVLRSLLPLEGVTICFTGKFNMPVDTHKGIAESLGAKVSGSVHSNTTLVVFGIGAQSKLDKAIEHDLPRMSESGWLWIASLLGYGKQEHVSPYGKFSTGGIIPKEVCEAYVGADLQCNQTGVQVAVSVPVIPTLREIHDQVLAEVTDWRAKYGRDSMPSTFSIAKAIHQMLMPPKGDEPETFFDILKTMEYKSTKE